MFDSAVVLLLDSDRDRSSLLRLLFLALDSRLRSFVYNLLLVLPLDLVLGCEIELGGWRVGAFAPMAVQLLLLGCI